MQHKPMVESSRASRKGLWGGGVQISQTIDGLADYKPIHKALENF